MFFGTRWQRLQSYATIAAWHNAAILDDDKFTIGDIPETAYAAGMLGLIWSPQIALVVGSPTIALNVVEAAALTGLIASYAIGGAEGAEIYVDYISSPVSLVKEPEKRAAFIQASQYIVAGVNPMMWVGGEFGRYLGEHHQSDLFKNRWLTGPYLPF